MLKETRRSDNGPGGAPARLMTGDFGTLMLILSIVMEMQKNQALI